jgi:hypothetical protein
MVPSQILGRGTREQELHLLPFMAVQSPPGMPELWTFAGTAVA